MLLRDSAPSCTLGKLLIEDGRELVPCFRRAISRITRPLVRYQTKKKNAVVRKALGRKTHIKIPSILVQSNLFITDTKGTGISVHIVEVSVLER